LETKIFTIFGTRIAIKKHLGTKILKKKPFYFVVVETLETLEIQKKKFHKA